MSALGERQILVGVGAQVQRFAEQWIVQTKGRWAGKPLAIEPWQSSLLDELFLVYDDGERVYKEALIGIARKNGKSTLSAAIALYGLLAANEEGPEVYAAAASRDQARIVFDQAVKFVEQSPKLRDWLKPQRSAILCKANNGVFRVLAADAPLQYGLNPSLVVIDELWAHRNPELYFALTTGQLARENALVVDITTAGWDRESIAFSLYRRGCELKTIDEMRRAGFLMAWHEADPALDYRDERGWKMANPASWIRIEDLRREAQRLPEPVFRRLHLNQWTESEDAWIKSYEWDACAGRPVFDATRPSWIAVDVGVRRDSAAITWAQWHDEKLHVGATILLPELQPPNFGVADIRGHVGTEGSKHRALREIVFDPWSFRESAELLAEFLPMVEFPQTASRMAPASESLYELVIGGRLVHDGDLVLRQQVLAAVAAPTDRGGWRLSKRKSLERIDGAISLAMCVDRAVTMRFVKPTRRTVHF